MELFTPCELALNLTTTLNPLTNLSPKGFSHIGTFIKYTFLSIWFTMPLEKIFFRQGSGNAGNSEEEAYRELDNVIGSGPNHQLKYKYFYIYNKLGRKYYPLKLNHHS